MKFIKNRIGPFVSRLIMPAQNCIIQEHRDISGSVSAVPGETIKTVASTQGATIDVFEVAGTSVDAIDIKNQKVFIHLHGSCIYYDVFKEFYRKLAKGNPDHRIVGFNCRNVQYSKGIATCEDDWVDDAVAVIRDYEKQGISLENIVLIGHSLGGAILTMAAARIYQEELASKGKQAARSVKVFSNRSFSTVAHVVAEWLSGGKIGGLVDGLFFGGIYLTIKTISVLFNAGFLASVTAGLISSLYIVGITALLVGVGHIFPAKPTLAKPFIRLLVDGFLRLSFGPIDALSAYKLLPDNAKDHVMVKDDEVIPPKASLHYGLKPINSPRKQALRERIEKANKAILNGGVDEALQKELRDCTEELLNLKDSKLRLSSTNFLSTEAHNWDPGFLRTYHKNRGKLGMPKQTDGAEIVQRKLVRMF